MAAARRGDLEGAVEAGNAALDIARRSVPSLLMVAGDLVAELRSRDPGEPGMSGYLQRIDHLAGR